MEDCFHLWLSECPLNYLVSVARCFAIFNERISRLSRISMNFALINKRSDAFLISQSDVDRPDEYDWRGREKKKRKKDGTRYFQVSKDSRNGVSVSDIRRYIDISFPSRPDLALPSILHSNNPYPSSTVKVDKIKTLRLYYFRKWGDNYSSISLILPSKNRHDGSRGNTFAAVCERNSCSKTRTYRKHGWPLKILPYSRLKF